MAVVANQQLLHEIHPGSEAGQVAGDSTSTAAPKAVTLVAKQTLQAPLSQLALLPIGEEGILGKVTVCHLSTPCGLRGVTAWEVTLVS